MYVPHMYKMQIIFEILIALTTIDIVSHEIYHWLPCMHQTLIYYILFYYRSE